MLGPLKIRKRSERKQNKPEAIAAVLMRLFPEGQHAMKNPELAKSVQEAEPGIGVFSPRTFSRAIAIAWPHGSQRAPSNAKPRLLLRLVA